jgi:hypothetical protein
LLFSIHSANIPAQGLSSWPKYQKLAMNVTRLAPLFGLFVFTLLPADLRAANSAAELAREKEFRSGFGSLPVSFAANIGQADAAVEFVASGQGGDLWLTRDEAWLAVRPGTNADDPPQVLRLKLLGANPSPKLEGLGLLSGQVNYFYGNDPKDWHLGAPTYARVEYHDVYPGVDVIYHGSWEKLEYDFVVEPGGNPGAIVLEFAGADKITVDAGGDLLLHIGNDSIRQHKPVVYQQVGGERQVISGKYVLRSGMKVGLLVGDYDKKKALIIDPTLDYSSVFGGSGLTLANGIGLDAADNVYITGYTTAADFPTSNPFQAKRLGGQNAFVTKFDTNGNIVYSTYLAGNNTDSGQSIAVDTNGDAYITGYTASTNFPTLNALYSTNAGSYDGFVTELNPAGNGLIFSTYLGGSSYDMANSICLDTNGNAIITGCTYSTNFPTTNAVQSGYGGNADAFVAKLAAGGGSLVYSTYLGGSRAENIPYGALSVLDSGGAVAVDIAGNAYVTGSTISTNFPVLNAFQPTNGNGGSQFESAGFVTKLDPLGNLVYSTYFGGQYGDLGCAIGVDFAGNVYFGGSDALGSLPTTNAYQPNNAGFGVADIGDGFLAAFDPTGTNLLYCTYLGGSGDDQINGLAVRPEDGAVAVVGFTDSPNFPLVNPVQASGNQSFFVSTSSGNWSTSNSGLTSGDVIQVVFDPSHPSIVYALTPSSVYKSFDGGAQWTSMGRGLGYLGIYLYTFDPVPNLLGIDPINPTNLYLGGYGGVYKTTNGGTNWAAANTGLPTYPGAQALAVDPGTPSNIYLGTGTGIYKSTNGGNSWNVMTNGLTSLSVTALIVDPHNSSNVYAGTTSGLFKSTNGGGHWNVLADGFSSSSVAALAFSPANPPALYVAVDGFSSTSSLVVSTNGGTNWTDILDSSGFYYSALTVAAAPVSSGPSLTIAASGSNDILAWPSTFAGYALAFTPALEPPSFQLVSVPPTISNGSLVVTNPMIGTQGYYVLILTNLAASLPPTIYVGTTSAGGQGVLESTDGCATCWNYLLVGLTRIALRAIASGNYLTLW